MCVSRDRGLGVRDQELKAALISIVHLLSIGESSTGWAPGRGATKPIVREGMEPSRVMEHSIRSSLILAVPYAKDGFRVYLTLIEAYD
jgi:hypothetical protein